MPPRLQTIVFAAATLLMGCGRGQEEVPLSTVPHWRLAAAPDLEIREDGEPGHDLFQVRAARSLPDGGVLVLNGGSLEVRRFDREGRLVNTIGRPGEGPGEFRFPIDMQLLGDTVVVYDMILRRLMNFDLDGALLGETSFAEEPWATPGVVLRVLPGGDLLVVDLAGGAPIDPVTHLRRKPYLVLRHRTHEGVTDSLGEWPGAAFVVHATDRGEQAWVQPFGVTTAATASGAHTFIGTSDAYRIRVLGRDGVPQGEIDDPRPRRTVDDDLAQAVIDWRVAAGPATNAAATRSALTNAVLPGTVPSFGELLADEDGLLWVAPYWLPGAEVRSWEVWEPTGKLRAVVEVPADLQVLAIERDALVAVRTDGDGAEQAVRFRLSREPSSDDRASSERAS